MGLFQWLGSLLDDLIEWLGKLFADFLRALVWAIQKIWETVIATVLIAAFAAVATLYVIFYAGYVLGETIMEVWDPRNLNKPSETFKIKQAPQSSPLPKQRSDATILQLENWN